MGFCRHKKQWLRTEPLKRRSGSPWGRRAYSALRTPALASRPVPGLTCLAVTFYGYFRNDASAALQRLYRVAPSSRHMEIVAGEGSGNHPSFVARLHRNAEVGSKLPPTREWLTLEPLSCRSELARDSSRPLWERACSRLSAPSCLLQQESAASCFPQGSRLLPTKNNGPLRSH